MREGVSSERRQIGQAPIETGSMLHNSSILMSEIWIFTALGEVSTKVLIFMFYLSALNKSSTACVTTPTPLRPFVQR